MIKTKRPIGVCRALFAAVCLVAWSGFGAHGEAAGKEASGGSDKATAEGPRSQDALISRIPMRKPCTKVILKDTEKDFEPYDSKTKTTKPFDSRAECTLDPKTGTYHFKWRQPDEDKWYYGEWTPPSQLSVVVEARIIKPVSGHGFQYVYALANSVDSRQGCDTFCVESQGASSPVASPERFRPFSTRFEHGRYGISWIRAIEGQYLAPGASCDGFAVESPGLPAIINCWASGKAGKGGVPWFDDEPPSSIDCAMFALTGRYNECLVGLTVGPGSRKTSWELVLSYLPVCFEQGWLSDGSTLNVIQEELTAFQTASDGPPGDMVKPIDAFLEKFEEWSKDDRFRIASEAYALIRYNCEWLRDEYAKQAEGGVKISGQATVPTAMPADGGK